MSPQCPINTCVCGHGRAYFHGDVFEDFHPASEDVCVVDVGQPWCRRLSWVTEKQRAVFPGRCVDIDYIHIALWFGSQILLSL